MRASFAAPLALAALAVAAPQGVTSAIAPSTTAPAGCSGTYSGTFAIQIINVTGSSKRDLEKREDTTLVMTLSKGILLDSQGRTGYIASNRQFQFDKPAQAGAIYTAGWSVCGNGSLAIGGNAIFYQCLSGTFYNLYDQSTGAQCSPVYIDAISNGGSTSSATPGVASQTSDGQITASAVASQQSDGQITATAGVTTSARVSQISDGQIQATTAASSAAVVSQISDGQIQATTSAAVVSQISDGQIQATTAAATKSSTTAALVSQISDGQIQATTKSNTTVASATATAAKYTGAAVPFAVRSELFGLAAGVLAVAML